jgi:hypothetical protein
VSTAASRLAAVCDLTVAAVRDSAGRHEYDGVVQDLSAAAVREGLARLGGPPLDDPHDEAHLSAVESRLAVELGQVELHRRSPRPLLAALDLSVYDKEYAPVERRRAARTRHLQGWPDAVEASLPSLDLVSAPAAQALLPAVRGAAAAVSADEAGGAAALAAHARLVAHLERCSTDGDPEAALGGAALAALMADGAAEPPDLEALAAVAGQERDRLRARLADASERLQPGRAPRDVVAELVQDHPDATGVLVEARALTAEVQDFVRSADLLDDVDGECLVLPSPPSRRWATAMLTWAAPYEPDGPSVFGITPPDPSWPEQQQRQWLRSASRTTLPSTTAHEVAPGHFSHGRALRRLTSDVRRSLHSPTFVEGWAHYAEELMVEQGFRSDDPRFALGVAMKALMRVTRLTSAIGVHTGALTTDEATRLFEQDAFLQGPAARAEALRAVIDPTYGRYTTGKLAVLRLRERARQRWGDSFTLRRFHRALLALGAPPVGLLDAALDDAPGTAGG